MKQTVALTVTAVLASAAVFAQSPSRTSPATPPATTAPAPQASTSGPPGEPASARMGAIFDQLNTSHTGKMTRQEAQAHPTVAAGFDSADTNKDGVLTKDEFLAAFQPAQ
jgi:hypothetical protein